ncbi:spore coat associated protein CotJA [Thermosediminibacter litoriperuensis]|uniref:Spore coat associated protein JA (CotJA) n=1 Tax=Thermosediminibacter litoriperuensis TaxID=291989 RepID=A0A5S5AYS5_9FIRM|nr:spore coat associated protein CotJA [Thermosediminibacter litoriperuensis]TYP57627.1 spore coat associated protein JA (CotJA) [Thermosediminibacter litoriperuensis]
MTRSESMSKGHDGMRLAEAYIPMQTFGETFDPRTALMYGTIFPELYRPYRPKHGKPHK